MNFRTPHQNKFLESFNFSSLTDVVMQLLIFFLLTFSFANIQGMNVTLPKSSITQAPLKKTVTVAVSKEKRVYVGGDEVTKNALPARLKEIMAKDPDQQIVVQADRQLALQDVVEILDIAKGAGATMFYIATESVKGK